MAPVIKAASELGLQHSVWLTGQHSDSMQDLIADFGLEAKIVQPAVLEERSSIGTLVLWIPGAMRDCYKFVRATTSRTGAHPLLIIHGDTLSTLVCAVAGRIGGADIVHLESGLTSGTLLDPFPEELLRRLTFRLTDFAVCPNEAALVQMSRFGCRGVVNTLENTLLDSVRCALSVEDRSFVAAEMRHFVVSVHRVGNIFSKSRLRSIVREVALLAEIGDVHFVLHPPTEKRLVALGLLEHLKSSPRVHLTPRMPYSHFIRLLSGARAVFSDGGSNQEELSYLGVPTILYRDRSERPDGLGRNVVFRSSIPDDLRLFIESGALDKLRVEARHLDGVEPSRIAVAALRTWAAPASPESR